MPLFVFGVLIYLLVVALHWTGPERTIAVALYAYRLVGFVAFELTGQRDLLLVFPNVFEPWFLLVAAIHRFRPGSNARPSRQRDWDPCPVRTETPGDRDRSAVVVRAGRLR